MGGVKSDPEDVRMVAVRKEHQGPFSRMSSCHARGEGSGDAWWHWRCWWPNATELHSKVWLRWGMLPAFSHG